MNFWIDFSGGLRVEVRGNGFQPIQRSSPKMVFYSSEPSHAKKAYYGVGCYSPLILSGKKANMTHWSLFKVQTMKAK